MIYGIFWLVLSGILWGTCWKMGVKTFRHTPRKVLATFVLGASDMVVAIYAFIFLIYGAAVMF